MAISPAKTPMIRRHIP